MTTRDRALTALAGVSSATWLVLAFARDRFWATDTALPDVDEHERTTRDWPDVAIIVPARNEADVLPHTLPTLLAQDYPGRWHVTLVDDDSDDATADLAIGIAKGTDKLHLVTAAPRPENWAGKVWAMREGVRSLAEDPHYVLLTDADIAHPPDSLTRLVAHAERDDRDVVSLMALLPAETGWERLIVPAFVYFFAQLYPFSAVSRDDRRTAAAAGGCLLVRRRTLRHATYDFAAMAGAVIDDVTLAGLVARSGGRLFLGMTTDVVSVRAYPRLADLWDMVARSAYTQLRHSPVLLAGTVAGLVTTYLVPVVTTITGPRRARVLGATAWATMTATYLPMMRHYRLHPARALTLPASALLYLGMTLDSARRHARGRGAAWKGR